MACELMMMSDSYRCCCDCWKQHEQWDVKRKPLNHSAPSAPHCNEVAARATRKAQQGTREPRYQTWQFFHFDSSNEYISAYRRLFSSGLTSDNVKNANCCATRTLQYLSLRTNRSKLRKPPPPPSQLQSSIVIIGVSRDTKRGGRAAETQFGAIDVIEHYAHHHLEDWKPPLDELFCERGQLHEQPQGTTGPPVKSSEATPCRAKITRDSAVHYGRLLAGKLRPVSIVDDRLYDQSVKTLKCITPDHQGNVEQNRDCAETECRLFVGEKPIKPAAIGQQLVHFRGSIAVGVSEAQVAPPTLHARSRTVVSNGDEAKGCTVLRTLFRRERDIKSNDEHCQLMTRRSYVKSPPNSHRPSHSREPFKTVCPSRSLHCFLRSKQRRCLHYRKAVLGEGITCLPYEVNKKWSSDSSIVHSN